MTEMTKRKLFFHIGKDRGHIFLSYAKEYSCIVIVVMPAYHTDISVFWWHVLLQHMSRFLLATILPSGYRVLFNIMHTMLFYDFFPTEQEYRLVFSSWSIQCKKKFQFKIRMSFFWRWFNKYTQVCVITVSCSWHCRRRRKNIQILIQPTTRQGYKSNLCLSILYDDLVDNQKVENQITDKNLWKDHFFKRCKNSWLN